jgi:predicted regulator of Ras-like GTPase activity (Roadblock/LC7/MglB family)
VAVATTRGTLDEELAQLRRLSEVMAVIIAQRDGLVIASNSSRRLEPRKLAAMAASIVGTSEMAVSELEQGAFKEVMVESDDGTVLGVGAGEEAILIALVRQDANVGLVLLSLKKSAKEIEEFLSTGEGKELLRGIRGGHSD